MSKKGASRKDIGRRAELVPCRRRKEKMGSGCGRLKCGRRVGRLFPQALQRARAARADAVVLGPLRRVCFDRVRMVFVMRDLNVATISLGYSLWVRFA
jgi:hypothetical protein